MFDSLESTNKYCELLDMNEVKEFTVICAREQTVRIKWPNDIYVGNKKICGILISNKVKGANLSVSIVGIGLNVNQTVFPDWVPNPVSIKQVSGRDESLEVVLKRVVDAVELRYIQLRDGWFSGVGEMDKEIMATIVGVNRFGHLELVTDSGDTITCQLKELKFLGV